MDETIKENQKYQKIWLFVLILGICLPVLIIIIMALFIYPNNDGLVNFIMKYRFLLGLY